MSALDARVLFLMLAQQKVGGALYMWGGESNDEGGFDCSGYVCDTLIRTARAWPDLYGGGRLTAQGLYDYFAQRGDFNGPSLEGLLPGALAFYRRPGKRFHHVAIHVVTVPPIQLKAALGGGGQQLYPVGPIAFEAGGGGSRIDSPRDALQANAAVRLSDTDSHGRGVEAVYLDPFANL